MDRFVQGALYVQRGLTLGLGTALGLCGALWLLIAPRDWVNGILGQTLIALYLASTVWRIYRRARVLDALSAPRRELELAVHLTTCVYAVVTQVQGQFAGPYHALAYALVAGLSGLLCVRAVVLSVLLAIGLEFGLGHARLNLPLQTAATHAALLAAFAGLNTLVLRGEVQRVRRLSKQRVESELSRIKEAARNYRLTGVPKSAADGAFNRVMAPPGDEDRLVRSSIDQVQVNLRFMLTLLRRTLRLRTAALLWLDDSGQRLLLREASSELPNLETGPFGAKEGVLSAALSSGHIVTIDESKATGRMPLLPRAEPAGALAAVPVLESGHAVGVLLVENERGAGGLQDASGLLADAASYALRVVESERSFVGLQRAKTEQGKLYQAADMLAEARSEVAVIRAGVDAARQFASFDFAAVTLFHAESSTHEICAVSGPGANDLVGQTFENNTGLVSMVVSNQHPLPYKGEYHRSRQVVFASTLPLAEMPSLIILPLKVHDSVLGTLVLGSNTKGAFGEGVRPILEVLARHVAVSLANARMMKRLEDLATTDGLTGLLNKRALTEVARQKLRSAQRFKKPLSVIIGDIDHFKRVNDQFGHDVGDQVIQGFADVLRKGKRETDAVARFGGEEFVIVCEETDTQGALLLAERIRTELAGVEFHSSQGALRVTCSLGVATLPASGQDWDALFKSADEALYSSKRSGRNRVTAWSPSMRGAAA
ncbi:MAG TPA: GGDEF domain-containing protein [Polyangiaceae bacterium]|jgi:diguanylate cyclase (GGDEF)-like protein|nr:GGDEF domain-containing protein [Polyangiaceae bacterium]